MRVGTYRKERMGMQPSSWQRRALCALSQLLFTSIASGQGMILPAQVRDLAAQTSTYIIVDVRSGDDFRQQHIQGAVNIPTVGIGRAGLSKTTLLVLYCGDSRCPLSHEAAKNLVEDGYQNIKVLYGGITEWKKKGYPVLTENAESPSGKKSESPLFPEEVWTRFQKRAHAAILDVRPTQEFASGHIPGARNVPLELLVGRAGIANDSEVVICDRIPARSRNAVQRLRQAGVAARELSGGISAWAAMGYAMETGAGNGS